jgi:hypothetical protein
MRRARCASSTKSPSERAPRGTRERTSLTPARVLSLALAALIVGRAWVLAMNPVSMTLVVAPLVLLIWFPAQVDDYTYGLWDRGNRIDAHTPAFLISGFGWMVLLLLAVLLFRSHGAHPPH